MALLKWMIVLLAVNILLFVGGVRVIDDSNYNFLGRFVDTSQLESTNQTVLSDNFTDILPRTYQESGGGGLFSFVDALKTVVSFAVFLVNLVFTPIGLFLANGLPWQIGIMLGLPLILAGVILIAQFIRGVSG